MKVDITTPEQMFASLITGLGTFVFNNFQEYEQKQEILIEEIKKLREENEKLKEGKEEEK